MYKLPYANETNLYTNSDGKEVKIKIYGRKDGSKYKEMYLRVYWQLKLTIEVLWSRS